VGDAVEFLSSASSGPARRVVERGYQRIEALLDAKRDEFIKHARSEAEVFMAEQMALIEAKVDEKIAEIEAKIDEQIELLMSQARETLQSRGAQFGDMALDRDMFDEQARKRVALGLLTTEIVKQQNMAPAPDVVRTKVESVAASYDSPDDVVNWYYADPERLSSIESLVLEDQVVDWVTENADVKEEPTTFDEMMKNKR
jgi:trigger factor